MSTTWLAGCKINLGLHVLRRRPDGYHDIESVLVPIPWHDVLHVDVAESDSFTSSDPLLPTDDRNLCVRAVARFRDHYGETPPVRVHLEKNLPVGAGLGGGSSDAAAVLRALAQLTGVKATSPDLLAIAASIGSDVPFFMHEPGDEPRIALATGRGEVLTPLQLDLPFEVVIATPDVSISTADAYAGVTPNAKDRPPLVELVGRNPPEAWRGALVNDFEPFIFAAFPQLSAVKDTLYGSGALYASLSGTGSSVYGLFADRDAADDARRALRARNIRGVTSQLLRPGLLV